MPNRRSDLMVAAPTSLLLPGAAQPHATQGFTWGALTALTIFLMREIRRNKRGVYSPLIQFWCVGGSGYPQSLTLHGVDPLLGVRPRWERPGD